MFATRSQMGSGASRVQWDQSAQRTPQSTHFGQRHVQLPSHNTGSVSKSSKSKHSGGPFITRSVSYKRAPVANEHGMLDPQFMRNYAVDDSAYMRGIPATPHLSPHHPSVRNPIPQPPRDYTNEMYDATPGVPAAATSRVPSFYPQAFVPLSHDELKQQRRAAKAASKALQTADLQAGHAADPSSSFSSHSSASTSHPPPQVVQTGGILASVHMPEAVITNEPKALPMILDTKGKQPAPVPGAFIPPQELRRVQSVPTAAQPKTKKKKKSLLASLASSIMKALTADDRPITTTANVPKRTSSQRPSQKPKQTPHTRSQSLPVRTPSRSSPPRKSLDASHQQGTAGRPISPPYMLHPRTMLTPAPPIVFFSPEDPYYGFSTHSPHKVLYKKKLYPTAEHLYQSMKFLPSKHGGSLELAERVRTCDPSPQVAVFEGRQNNNHARPDWKEKRKEWMDEILYSKFSQHPELRQQLVSTYPAPFVFANPADSFWGVGKEGNGRNEMGHSLERVRERFLVEMNR